MLWSLKNDYFDFEIITFLYFDIFNKDYIYLKINPDGIFYLYNLSLQ